MCDELDFRVVGGGDEEELERVCRELMAREPIFHREEWGTTREEFEQMTAEDFSEIGASGRWYERAYVLDVLDERRKTPKEESWITSGFVCRRLAPDVYLLTYMLVQEGTRRTRRSTVWCRSDDGAWKIVFHQGTIIETE